MVNNEINKGSTSRLSADALMKKTKAPVKPDSLGKDRSMQYDEDETSTDVSDKGHIVPIKLMIFDTTSNEDSVEAQHIDLDITKSSEVLKSDKVEICTSQISEPIEETKGGQEESMTGKESAAPRSSLNETHDEIIIGSPSSLSIREATKKETIAICKPKGSDESSTVFIDKLIPASTSSGRRGESASSADLFETLPLQSVSVSRSITRPAQDEMFSSVSSCLSSDSECKEEATDTTESLDKIQSADWDKDIIKAYKGTVAPEKVVMKRDDTFDCPLDCPLDGLEGKKAFIRMHTIRERRTFDLHSLIIVGILASFGGLGASILSQSSCHFATIDKYVGYYQYSFEVHVGMWQYSPMDSVFNGHSYCSSYSNGESFTPPFISRSLGLIAAILGTFTMMVVWVYLLFIKTNPFLWRWAGRMAIAAGVFQLSTLSFFANDMCRRMVCGFGTGSIASITAACLWFVIAFELMNNVPVAALPKRCAELESRDGGEETYKAPVFEDVGVMA